MEGVPKLPMLTFKMKTSPENGDLSSQLKRLIRVKYGEDPETFSKEISEFETLRANACIRATQDSAGVAAVKKYYCQLHFLHSRFFKITGYNSSSGPLTFTWYDIYTGGVSTYSDIQYEMGCALYNSGAIHSILGGLEPRTTSEGMKMACTHFQCAAWAFHSMPDRHPTELGTDLAPDLLAFLSLVCLAQAQECILEKSILDHRKSSIIVKVGAQVVDYYKQAKTKLEKSTKSSEEEDILESIGRSMAKAWLGFVDFKMVYYTAVTYFFMGLQAEEAEKMGERVAYFEAASSFLTNAQKLGKDVSSLFDKNVIKSALTFTYDVIQGKHEISKKENEFVFHEKIPEFETLPELKGASLVKRIGFEVGDPAVSGPDIFGRLVPMEAHEASSIYSEEKAKLLRGIGEDIEKKGSELAVFMSSLNLDEVPKPGDHIALPQELIECAAGLSVKSDAVKKLTEAMARIASVSSDVEANINEIKELLQEEKKQGQAILKPKPILAELESEVNKYEEAHSMASASNLTLHKAMKLHLGNLKLLGKPLDELQKSIPSLADLDEESEANIAEFHRIIGKVEEMKKQRVTLMDQLRKDLQEDDITKKLIVYKDKDISEIFDDEMKKYKRPLQVINTNLSAQDTILQALTDANARYAETRKTVMELLNARNEMIGSLVASYFAYEDLLLKAAKGLEFYDKLDSNVSKLLNRVKGVVTAQQDARDAVLFKGVPPTAPPPSLISGSIDPKPTLKDYLNWRKEENKPPAAQSSYGYQQQYQQGYYPQSTAGPPTSVPSTATSVVDVTSNTFAVTNTTGGGYPYQYPQSTAAAAAAATTNVSFPTSSGSSAYPNPAKSAEVSTPEAVSMIQTVPSATGHIYQNPVNSSSYNYIQQPGVPVSGTTVYQGMQTSVASSVSSHPSSFLTPHNSQLTARQEPGNYNSVNTLGKTVTATNSSSSGLPQGTYTYNSTPVAAATYTPSRVTSASQQYMYQQHPPTTFSTVGGVQPGYPLSASVYSSSTSTPSSAASTAVPQQQYYQPQTQGQQQQQLQGQRQQPPVQQQPQLQQPQLRQPLHPQQPPVQQQPQLQQPQLKQSLQPQMQVQQHQTGNYPYQQTLGVATQYTYGQQQNVGIYHQQGINTTTLGGTNSGNGLSNLRPIVPQPGTVAAPMTPTVTQQQQQQSLI